jgi:hypothetical protein
MFIRYMMANYIIDGADVALFIFETLQRAFALKDPTLLNKDFQCNWDRVVTYLHESVLHRDLEMLELEAILIIRGNFCTTVKCGALGQLAEMCGCCHREPLAYVAPSDLLESMKFKQDRAVAKALFVAANPLLTHEVSRHQAFVVAQPEWYPPPTVSVSPPSPASTKTTALSFIFGNQQLFGLPFDVV